MSANVWAFLGVRSIAYFFSGHCCFCTFKTAFLTGQDFRLQGETEPCLEKFWCHSCGLALASTGTRDAVKHSTLHGTAPYDEGLSYPKL